MNVATALISRFSGDAFADLARRRLATAPPERSDAPASGDYMVAGLTPDAETLARAAPAAVLIPVIPRDTGTSVLFTVRSATLRKHKGQISFPGGRIDATDDGALAAALRETREEIGIAAQSVMPLGFLGPYVTGTGYRITPVVGLVDPTAVPRPNPDEVAEVFEVPLAFLMDPAEHKLHQREWQGVARSFFAIEHGDRYIWGATAGMLRMLWQRVYAEDHS